MEKLATEVWKPSGLPPAQAYLLLHIMYYSESFSFFISRRLLLSPAAITHLVDKLEKKKLVYRLRGYGCTLIKATDKAWALEPVLEKCSWDFKDRCEELLGSDDADTLKSMMTGATDKIYEATEKK